MTPELAELSGFGAPATPVRISLSIPRQSAESAASRRAINVRLEVSTVGLTRIAIKQRGRMIAVGLVGILRPGSRIVPVGLTGYGAGVLSGKGSVHLTASATARNLVIQGASASTEATLG